jgi:hypothetical protein
VLGHRRLGQPELALDAVDDRPGGELATGQQLQDPTPHGIAEDVKRMHGHYYKQNQILVKPYVTAHRRGPSAVRAWR